MLETAWTIIKIIGCIGLWIANAVISFRGLMATIQRIQTGRW